MNDKMMGIRGWSLLIPALLSALGFFCFGVLGFSFTELTVLPEAFRTALVLTGAFALAFGAEIGTLSNVVEIYRKGARVQGWDAVALAISILATFTAFILAFATLLGVAATWGATVRLYGPIALGLLAALDSYGNFLEFGLYLNSYDARLSQWEGKQEQAAERKRQDAERLRQAVAQGVLDELQRIEAEAQVSRERRKAEREERKVAGIGNADAQASVQVAPKNVAPAQAPIATIADWRAIIEHLNGERANLTIEQLQDLLKGAGYALPSARTQYNWLADAQREIPVI
jgi:hypothetical protein